jgi:hypothetical protein
MAEEPDPLARAYELVGRFFYHFGRVELQLDEAITKLFNLDPTSSPIITSNIDFLKKAHIVHTAVDLQAKSGQPVSVDVEKTFGAVKGINNPSRVMLAHVPFEPAEDGVRFKLVTAKGKLKAEEPVWTAKEFEKQFQIMQELETTLEQIVHELQPNRIKWPEPAQLPAYLQTSFFMGTPLGLIKEAERAVQKPPV